MGEDTDAIWKPGFTGEVVYRQPAPPPAPPRPPPRPAPSSPEPTVAEHQAPLFSFEEAHDAPPAPLPSAQRRRRMARRLVVLGVVAVIVAAALTLTLSRGRGADSSAVHRIPTAVDEQWSATIPGRVVSVTGTADLVLATSGADRDTLTALDRRDGTRRWSRTLARLRIDQVSVQAGVVVCIASPSEIGFGGQLVGLDGRSGEERWRRRLPGPGAAWMDGRRIITPQVDSRHPMLSGLDLIDPRTGATLRSIAGDGLLFSEDGVQTSRGHVFRLYDIDTFERTAAISLPALRDTAARIVPTATGTLAVTASQAVLFDARGVPLSSRSLGPQEHDYAPFVVDLGGVVVVQSGDVISAVTVTGTELDIAWSRRGQLLDRTGEGDDGLVAVTPASGAPSSTSGAPIALVDATTGVAVWTGMVPFRRPGQVLADNGLVAQRAASTRFRQAIAGIGLDGTMLWRHTVRRGADTALIDAAVVEYGPTPGRNDETTLTLLR